MGYTAHFVVLAFLHAFVIAALSTHTRDHRRFSWPWTKHDHDTKHEDKESLDYVLFRLYTRETIDLPQLFYDTQFPEQHLGYIDITKPIKVIIHGWKGHSNCSFTRELVNDYLSALDYNVIGVDWSGHGSRDLWYPNARGKVGQVAFHVAKFLDRLSAEKGVKLEDVHVIGHSLGAHIAGIAGRLVTRGKIGRITGLDPAGPLFSKQDVVARLDLDSANFVDVIHTTIHTVGLAIRMGHVDFYPNGGILLQPGCGIDVTGKCGHRRSYIFFGESISSPKGFPAVSCEDWEHYQERDCNEDNVTIMGEWTPMDARGVYYLSTNEHSPMGTGEIWS